MNNYWVTNFNADQQGEFKWSYFINSGGDPSLDYAMRFAQSLRVPMLSRLMPPHGKNSQAELPSCSVVLNDKPVNGRPFSINSDNLSIISMTPSKKENSLILQIREISGRATKLELKSEHISNFEVKVCNAIGEELDSDLSFKPYESKFVKLSFGGI